MSYTFDLPVLPARAVLDDANWGITPGFWPLQWAKEHCPSYVTCNAIQKEGIYQYRFYFGSERDLVAFALRWAQ